MKVFVRLSLSPFPTPSHPCDIHLHSTTFSISHSPSRSYVHQPCSNTHLLNGQHNTHTNGGSSHHSTITSFRSDTTTIDPILHRDQDKATLHADKYNNHHTTQHQSNSIHLEQNHLNHHHPSSPNDSTCPSPSSYPSSSSSSSSFQASLTTTTNSSNCSNSAHTSSDHVYGAESEVPLVTLALSVELDAGTTYLDSEKCPVLLSSYLSTQQAHKVIYFISHYYRQVYVYGNSWHAILRAADLDINCILIRVLLCDYYIARMEGAEAMRHLEYAIQHASEGNEREQLYVKAFEQWIKFGNLRQAVAVFQQIVNKYPDMFAAKRGQLLAWVDGDNDTMLNIVNTRRSDWEDRPYYYSTIAFALEENGLHAEAEVATHKGLKRCNDDIWSQHAVAHIFYSTARCQQGIDWMKSLSSSPAWLTSMSFMYTHMWFHFGLFLLDVMKFDEFLAMFDEYIWHRTHTVIHAPFNDFPPCAIYSAHQHSPIVAKPVSPSATVSSTSLAPSSSSALQSGLRVISPCSYWCSTWDSSSAELMSSTFPATSSSWLMDAPFPLHDKYYIEDQGGALGLLWKYALRFTAAEWLQQQRLIQDQQKMHLQTAATLLQRRRQAIVERFHHILSFVPLPSAYPLHLVGVLTFAGLCYVGRKSEALQMKMQIKNEIALKTAEPKRTKYCKVLVPLIDAVMAYYCDGDKVAAGDLMWAAMQHSNELRILGGSIEQREVMDDFFLVAVLDAARSLQASDPTRATTYVHKARLLADHRLKERPGQFHQRFRDNLAGIVQ